MLVAAAALGGAAYGVWWMLDDALGRSLLAQIVSVGGGPGRRLPRLRGPAAPARAVPEAEQLSRLLERRFSRGTTP